MKYLPLRCIAAKVFVGTTPTRLTQRTMPTKQQPATTEAIEISVVKNSNLNNAGLQIGGEIELIQAFDRPSLKKHLLQPTDVLLTMRYKDFYCGIVGQQSNPCIAANNLSVLRQIDSNLTSGEYLTVWLRSEPGLKAIASIARPVQTTTSYSDWSYLTIENLLDLEVPIPSLHQQQQAIDAFHAIASLQLRHQTEMREQLDRLNRFFIPD